MDGPILELRQAVPMARTTASDLAFVQPAADLWEDDNQERGYHPRLFCQLALPYQDPGLDLPAWGRRNGHRSLVVRPGYEIDDDGEARSIGYPYGTMPRLLLSWLATEAVRTQRAEPVLGENRSDFMRHLGLQPTGGKTGTITRL